MKNILAIVLFLGISTQLFALEVLSLENVGSVVQREIEQTERNLDDYVTRRDGGGYSMYLNTIRLRLRPSFALTIPWLAKAKLQPEIELYWTR